MSLDLSGSEFEFFRQRMARGDVVLFLGAGFSADATNVTGGTLPLGRNLAKLLAEKAGFPYDGEPLPSVYQAVRPRIGDNQLWEYLNELYDVKGFADWYKILPQFVWHRIYTINIDNLVERIYQNSSTQVLSKIVCPTQPSERDPHFEKLQCIHLHGHIEYRQQGIVFSLSEFAQQTAGPNPWYQQLAEDLFTRPLLFVGTPMEEPMLYHYIEFRGLASKLAEIRPKSFLVNKTISEITKNSYLERNIHPIQADGKTFFETLAASVDLPSYSVNAVRNTVYPHITFQRNKGVSNPNIDRYFDLIIANALPPSPQMPPGAFFMGGEPTWADIDKRHDAVREIDTEFKASVLAVAQTPGVVVLYGPAGSGKTTTMMRTAVELAADGKTVFFGKGDERIDLEGIVQLARTRVTAGDMTRIYCFIDIISRHMGSVDILKHEIAKGLPITLVVADRANSYFNKCQSLVAFNAHEVTMPDLTEADIVSVLERLERFGFLGVLRQKTHPDRVRMFMDVAQKQMLVAMREATSGRGFDSILRSEFGELGHDAKLAYTITALAVAKGAPGVYRRHLMPALGATDYAKHRIIDELLRGVLVRANQTGTLLKPRHRFIANLIADEIAPTGLKVEAVTAFLRQIAADIVPNEIKRRAPAFVAYRGMINAAGLKDTFANQSDIILGLFDELKSIYNHDFLFWLQYGIAAIDAGYLDLGENYLNQSLAIRSGNHQAIHHMGLLHLMKASRGENPMLEQERAHEGIQTLLSQIYDRGDDDSYPYHAYLIHVSRWFAKAGKMITDKEWEDLRGIARIAESKYGREEMVMQAVKEVDRVYMMRAVRPTE